MNYTLLHLNENPEGQIEDSIDFVKDILGDKKKEFLENVLVDGLNDMPRTMKLLHLSCLNVFHMFFNSCNLFDTKATILEDILRATYIPLQQEEQTPMPPPSKPLPPMLPPQEKKKKKFEIAKVNACLNEKNFKHQVGNIGFGISFVGRQASKNYNSFGHGKSQGLKAYVPNIDFVIDDILSFIDFIMTQNLEFQELPKFVYGESMGGAICLLIHLKRPRMFKGAILIAPMCKISDKVKPRWPIPQFLTFFAKFAPTLAIVPTANLMDKSVKVPEKKIIGGMNPNRYFGKPRLGTVLELLRVTDFVSEKLCDVNLSFLVLHGSADVVTDPEVSRELYELAKSKDKTLKIYEGMMHSLLFGETDENVEIVRSDILAWLNDRC
ncbi:hypothetical protein K7X08_032544 [Anisodus acutangulus]|uniref:Serine aminopeptidase S33 domain-containing protein n=1 Tax=Anisodus acutangulus TaxID=402998 RepID=A0A9Q1N0M2_9SOLA|nr:hypothetical protein K7X08_032544 [Anisodus acutangulus]